VIPVKEMHELKHNRNWLTALEMILLEKIAVTQLDKIFIEPECSLPHSQELVTGPC
jgi:hypothetical protein